MGFLQTLTRKSIHCLLANDFVQTVQCSSENARQTPQSVSENNNYHHPLVGSDAGTRSTDSEGTDRHLAATKKRTFDDDSVGDDDDDDQNSLEYAPAANSPVPA